MKSTTKKSPPKASHKKAIKDLPVKGLQAARAESVKGGKLHEAACKGTHIPEVVIEVW